MNSCRIQFPVRKFILLCNSDCYFMNNSRKPATMCTIGKVTLIWILRELHIRFSEQKSKTMFIHMLLSILCMRTSQRRRKSFLTQLTRNIASQIFLEEWWPIAPGNTHSEPSSGKSFHTYLAWSVKIYLRYIMGW